MLTKEQYASLQQMYNVSEIPFLVISVNSSDIIAFPEHSDRFFNRDYWLDGTMQMVQNTHHDEIILNNVGEFSNQVVVWLTDELILHTVPVRTSLQSPYHLYALIEKGIPADARTEFFRFLLDIPPKSSKQLCDFASIIATLFSGRSPKSIYLASINTDQKLKVITDYEVEQLHDMPISSDSSSIVTYYTNLSKAIQEGDMPLLLDTLQSPVAGSKSWMTPGMIKDARYEFTTLLSIISKAAIDAGVPASTCIQMRKRFVIVMDSMNDIQKIIQYGYYCSQQFCEQVIRFKQKHVLSAYTKDAKNYIMDHLYDKIDTQSVSDALHINPKTLNQYFKKDMNTSIYHYILDQRLEESHYMLQNTVLPITYISELFNFSSQSHFTKLFREKYGITPHQLRIGVEA